MTRFPAIDRPCPVADRLDTVLQGDVCSHCRETVVDLDALSEAARLRRLASAERSLCVRYRAPIGLGLAAAALVASLPAAAQQNAALSAGAIEAPVEDEIVVGGIRILTPAERAEARREARRIEKREAAARREAERAVRKPVR